MRIQGRDAIPKRIDSVVVARAGGLFLEIKGVAIPSFEEFHKKCPMKSPGWIQVPGGEPEANINSPAHKAYLAKREKQFAAWLVLETITVPSEIEWTTVQDNDPDSWLGWKEELIAFGICAGECSKIEKMVNDVNALTDDSINKAMNDFLAALQKELNELKSSQQAGKETMKSSDPANDLDLFPQESESLGSPAGT